MAVNKFFVESGKKNDFDTEQWKESLEPVLCNAT